MNPQTMELYMLTTISGLLVLAAFVCSILALAGKVPVGVAPLFLSILALLNYLPLH